jgi:hypothetical protein
VSESVEQAALRRARENDWKGRAEREAAAILAETDFGPGSGASTYPTIVTLVAIGWLQGANYADHHRLAAVEDAFDELRAAL